MKLGSRFWISAMIFASLVLCLAALGQDEPNRRAGRWADQPHLAGTITAIRPDAFDIQSQDGKTATIQISSDTQFRKNRAAAQLADFKVGDRVMAVGEQQKDGPFLAKMVASFGAGYGAPAGGIRGGAFSREDLGKKFVIGQVSKIEDTKLTILRPDNVEQVIQPDENTSFRNDKGESVTLADIKVGDRVGGQGELKNGVFVPKILRIGVPNRTLGPNDARPPAPEPDQKPQPEKK
jgi:preprotein translocase subunit YajC